VTCPLTGVVPGPVKVKVVPSMVEGFIASLNVAVAMALGHVPLAGVIETTAGAPTPKHVVTPVVKLHTALFESALPNTSLARVEIVAVYRVLVARLSDGEKMAVLLPAL
jgi:hypothetical protein